LRLTRARLALGLLLTATSAGLIVGYQALRHESAASASAGPRSGSMVRRAIEQRAPAQSSLERELRKMRISPRKVHKVASASGFGKARAPDGGGYVVAVYIAQSPTPTSGSTCLIVELADDSVGDACDTDLFASGPVAWVSGFDGGPDSANIIHVYVAGVTQSNVATVQLQQGSTTLGTVAPTTAGGFIFDGVGLDPKGAAQLVGLDSAGHPLQTVSLPAAP
jgi:hypothetical protein